MQERSGRGHAMRASLSIILHSAPLGGQGKLNTPRPTCEGEWARRARRARARQRGRREKLRARAHTPLDCGRNGGLGSRRRGRSAHCVRVWPIMYALSPGELRKKARKALGSMRAAFATTHPPGRIHRPARAFHEQTHLHQPADQLEAPSAHVGILLYNLPVGRAGCVADLLGQNGRDTPHDLGHRHRGAHRPARRHPGGTTALPAARTRQCRGK